MKSASPRVPDERVGVDHELLAPLAHQVDELLPVRGLDLRVQPAPRGVHLVEREADELALRGLLLLPADLRPGVFLERAGAWAGRAVGRAGRSRSPRHGGPRRPPAARRRRWRRARRHRSSHSVAIRTFLQGCGAPAPAGEPGRARRVSSCRPYAEVATTRGAPQVPGPAPARAGRLEATERKSERYARENPRLRAGPAPRRVRPRPAPAAPTPAAVAEPDTVRRDIRWAARPVPVPPSFSGRGRGHPYAGRPAGPGLLAAAGGLPDRRRTGSWHRASPGGGAGDVPQPLAGHAPRRRLPPLPEPVPCGRAAERTRTGDRRAGARAFRDRGRRGGRHRH